MYMRVYNIYSIHLPMCVFLSGTLSRTCTARLPGASARNVFVTDIPLSGGFFLFLFSTFWLCVYVCHALKRRAWFATVWRVVLKRFVRSSSCAVAFCKTKCVEEVPKQLSSVIYTVLDMTSSLCFIYFIIVYIFFTHLRVERRRRDRTTYWYRELEWGRANE